MMEAVIALVLLIAAGLLGSLLKPSEEQTRSLVPEQHAGAMESGHGHHH